MIDSRGLSWEAQEVLQKIKSFSRLPGAGIPLIQLNMRVGSAKTVKKGIPELKSAGLITDTASGEPTLTDKGYKTSVWLTARSNKLSRYRSPGVLSIFPVWHWGKHRTGAGSRLPRAIHTGLSSLAWRNYFAASTALAVLDADFSGVELAAFLWNRILRQRQP
jgi:hypothetical protein